MVVTTKDLHKLYGKVTATNMLTKARSVIYDKTKIVSIIIDSGNKHGRCQSITQVMSVDTDDMVKYYETHIDLPRFAHTRARMIVNMKRWMDIT